MGHHSEGSPLRGHHLPAGRPALVMDPNGVSWARDASRPADRRGRIGGLNRVLSGVICNRDPDAAYVIRLVQAPWRGSCLVRQFADRVKPFGTEVLQASGYY